MQGGVKEFIKKMIHSLVLFSLAVCKEILMLVYCTIGLTGAFTVLSVGMKDSSFMAGYQMSYQEAVQYKELWQNHLPQFMFSIMLFSIMVLVFSYMFMYINQSGMGKRCAVLFSAYFIIFVILQCTNAVWRNMFFLLLFCIAYIVIHYVYSTLYKKKGNRIIYTDDPLMGVGVIPIICRECMKIIDGLVFLVGIWLLFKNPINKEFVLGTNSGAFISITTVIVTVMYQLQYSIRGQLHRRLFTSIASTMICAFVLIVELFITNTWKYALILYLICFLCRVLSCMLRIGKELLEILQKAFREKERKKMDHIEGER